MTYEFAVERVLLHHDHVDGLGVSEGKEAEASRAPGGAIAHDGAFGDFAKLREVVLE